MESTYKQLTAPAAEPVTLALVKRHVSVDHDDDDALIELDIAAAREYCEDYTGRVFGSRTFSMKLAYWPEDGYIRLPVDPVTAVTAIKYTDTEGDEQTVSPSDYAVWLEHSPPLVSLNYGFAYPTTELNAPAPITVEFTAGEAPPKKLAKAIMLLVEYWRKNPGGESSTGGGARGVPSAITWILDTLWTGG